MDGAAKRLRAAGGNCEVAQNQKKRIARNTTAALGANRSTGILCRPAKGTLSQRYQTCLFLELYFKGLMNHIYKCRTSYLRGGTSLSRTPTDYAERWTVRDPSYSGREKKELACSD